MPYLKGRIIPLALSLACICAFPAFSPVPAAGTQRTEYSLRFMSKAQQPEAVSLLVDDSLSPKVRRGVLFTYASRGAKKASIAGDFSDWSPIPMTKGKNGIWYYFLAESEKDNIRYKYMVDGIWMSDPANPERDNDGNGSFLSIARGVRSEESKYVSYRICRDSAVEFRRWDDRARFTSIVGDFNNWNPENDILSRDGSNIWRLKKRLPKGTYRYKYIVDGQWLPDVYNARSASDTTGGVCSVITVR
jgi:1,4-alpha-glucan branching enzyme